MKPRILLVEDEENLREAIKLNLEIEGYEVVSSDAGKDALKKKGEQSFDLLILDVMLPEIDGFQICENIRLTDTETPILFLTAKSSNSDKVAGLKLGADDYLSKPFNLEELLLRVRNLVRHSERRKKKNESPSVFKFGESEINFETFDSWGPAGRTHTLTKKEASLLKLLIERKGTVVPRTQILQYVWGYDVFPSTRTIDNFIRNFRMYFEKDPSNPVHFHSIRGVGYKFTDEDGK